MEFRRAAGAMISWHSFRMTLTLPQAIETNWRVCVGVWMCVCVFAGVFDQCVEVELNSALTYSEKS